ncbi:MAG: DMT family transporter [Defluviicoccus sp.]|nr:DMT family transporter [Defluviicoccus sp.]MDE0279390.1 DMT family transporter [Defluviicoccus sp.]
MIPGRFRALPANAQGALWILVGSLFLSANDAVVKTLGTDFHPIQMALFRYAIGMVLLLPWFVKAGRETWRTERLGTHFARAMIAGVGQAAVYYGVIHLYLADATAVAFTRPLFLTMLAVLFLGEVVGWRRWAATVFGFAGVLVMVRPGGAVFDVAWAVALAAAVLFALGIVYIRRLAATEPSIRILFYYHVFGIALFVGPSAAVWQPPETDQLALLMTIGALTCAGMVCFVQGFSIGEASFVGPFEYLRLIYAALIGYWMFAEIPSIWTGVGAAMIVASALYIARR